MALINIVMLAEALNIKTRIS
nr:hypothetical protein [Corynebacterium anserum]